ncbi:MAG: SDR family oxidoreductase [Actinobacteria bacterium]|nr:SDR family oxidoreductase [Actinomycetota bacterium]
MRIGISGGSGNLARETAEHLIDMAGAESIVLITRTPDGLGEFSDRGVEVRPGDFDRPETLADAFAGLDRLLLISTDRIGSRMSQHENAIAAASSSDIGFVAYTSYTRPEEGNPAAVAAEHLLTEPILRGADFDLCILRNSTYADYERGGLQRARETGKLLTNTGDGRVAYVSRDDCAAAAAVVLTGEGHAGQLYDVTGPELLDADGRAAVMSALIGSPVEVVQLDDEAFAERSAAATGMPIEMARMFATSGRAVREGYLDLISDDFEKLTGRSPKTLEAVLSE